MSERGNGGSPPVADDLRSLLVQSRDDNVREPELPPVQPPAEGPQREADAAPPKEPPKGERGAAAEPAGEPPARHEGEQPETGEPPPRAPAEPPEGAAAAAGVVEPPLHWHKDDKDRFLALPKEARAPFLDMYKRMENGLTQKLQRAAALDKDYGEIDRTIFTAPQREILASKGYTIPAIVNAWANVERSLGGAAEQRDDMIAKIIHNYKADPVAIARRLNELRGFAAPAGDGGNGAGGNGAAAPRTAADPVLAERLERLETEQRARALREDTEQRTAADRLIANFANEVDESGQLRHPFYAEVEDEMTGLAQLDRAMGKQPELQDLYNRAVWGNPNTREKQLALQREAEAKRQADERRTQAERARRAGSSITGAPTPGGTQSAAPEDMSLRDQIKASMASGGGSETSGGRGRI